MIEFTLPAAITFAAFAIFGLATAFAGNRSNSKQKSQPPPEQANHKPG